MKRSLLNLLVGFLTAVITWLALSYIFFPIKLSAPAGVYFTETITHMVPLKSFITIVLSLFAVFVCEQMVKKDKNG